MSWIFGTIDFETYGVVVSKSSGVLNLPKLQTEGHDWLDEDGLDYWQTTPKYDDREIVLNCWMLASADETYSGYENFITKMQTFTDAVKAEGEVTLQTPFIDIDDCSIVKGITVTRETNYVQDLQAGTFVLRITVAGDLDFKEQTIQRWNGVSNVATATVYTNNIKVNKTLQGDFYVTMSFESKEKLDLKYFDFVDILSNGSNVDRFYLPADPEFKKVSTNKFVYNLRFEHQSRWLQSSQFLNDRDEADFSYYANMDEIMDMIIDNHDRSWWQNFSKGTIASTERRNHLFSAEDCFSVLRRIAKDYDLEYEFEYVSAGKYKINCVEQVANTKAVTLEYGKGNGLYELTREPADQSELCTILYAYGAAKNLKPDYRGGMSRLSFDNNPLNNNDDLLTGAGPQEKTIYFDDIYPNRTSTITNYTQVLPSGLTEAQAEVWPDGIYKVEDSTLEFDLNDYLLGGLTAKIRMKSGDLAGYEFEIEKYDHDITTMFIIPFKDEGGYVVPNETLTLATGDSYTLVDMDQPESYVTIAEAELEAAATAYLADSSIPKFPYRCVVDPAFVALAPLGFEVGDRVTIIDTDYGINGLFRISNLTYDAYRLIYEFTLSDTARLTRRQSLEMRLEAVERAQERARKDQAESTVKDVETTNELRNRLLHPNSDHIKCDPLVADESIDPRMMAYDTGVPQFYLNEALVETNRDGDEDKIHVGTGQISITNWEMNTLSRYEIAKLRANDEVYDPTRTWDITATTIALTTKSGYYLYAKIGLATGETGCSIEVSTRHKEVKELIEDKYLYYKLGHITAGEE